MSAHDATVDERTPRPLPAGATAPASRAPSAPSAAPLPSEALLQGRKSVEISHNGRLYRLQATRQGKLILTK